MDARAWIGTSGFEYDEWRESFYGDAIPRSRWLEAYAEEFDTVELNGTFYRLPKPTTFEGWAQRTPTGFRFSVKASRYLTHLRRLREPAEPLDRLWTRARHLGDKLGPVLYQLPPRWRPNVERLEQFVGAVPDGPPQVVELRDRRWYRPEVFGVLDDAGIALCVHDMAGSEPPPRPAGPFVYVRFHGAGQRYGGRYPSQRLTAWADRIARWTDAGLTVWAYFNNDIGGHAPRDADRLRRLARSRGVDC